MDSASDVYCHFDYWIGNSFSDENLARLGGLCPIVHQSTHQASIRRKVADGKVYELQPIHE